MYFQSFMYDFNNNVNAKKTAIWHLFVYSFVSCISMIEEQET